MGRYAADMDGFTVSVRGLAPGNLDQLRSFHGIRDVRVASQVAGEQWLEVWTRNGDAPMAGFLGELTGLGATICSLQRATPLQGVVEGPAQDYVVPPDDEADPLPEESVLEKRASDEGAAGAPGRRSLWFQSLLGSRRAALFRRTSPRVVPRSHGG